MVVFLNDASILVATLKGTILIKLQALDSLIDFATALSTEELYFGALAQNG